MKMNPKNEKPLLKYPYNITNFLRILYDYLTILLCHVLEILIYIFLWNVKESYN